MKRNPLILGLALALVLRLGLETVAEEERTKDELLFMDIPMVITASRREQPITEAPATINIITSEDIKQSGATNIPDILQMLAGVDVLTMSAQNQHVGIRGFNENMNNKVLVLVDGRVSYWDGQGSVFWNSFFIGVDEIERIEVIKGPALDLLQDLLCIFRKTANSYSYS